MSKKKKSSTPTTKVWRERGASASRNEPRADLKLLSLALEVREEYNQKSRVITDKEVEHETKDFHLALLTKARLRNPIVFPSLASLSPLLLPS